MILALGFLTAAMLTLLFLPAVWRRAQRLARRRLEMQLPLSVDEIVAERDQLRAGFAVEQRRREQKYEALLTARGEDAAELGRRASALADLAAAGDTLRTDLSTLAARGAETARLLADTQAEAGALGIALYDSEGLRERREDVLRGLESAHQILQITSGQQHVALYELESRLRQSETTLKATESKLQTVSQEARKRAEENEILTTERDQGKAQALFFQQRRDALQAELAALGEIAAAQAKALAQGQQAMAGAKADGARAAEAAAGYERRIASLEARHKEALARAARALEQAVARERESALRLEGTRAEKAAVEGALQAAREERSRLQRELSHAPEGGKARAAAAGASADDEASLRRAVSDLADRLLRLGGAPAAAPVTPMPQLRGRPKMPVEKVAADADPSAA